jgi:hypothetical protein
MELGFGPKLSRVAAGVCFFLFFGLVAYFFGEYVMFGVMFLPVLLWLIVSLVLPKGPDRKKIADWGFMHLDIAGFFMERLDDRFESLMKRLRR